jgi:hypothetical protein
MPTVAILTDGNDASFPLSAERYDLFLPNTVFVKNSRAVPLDYDVGFKDQGADTVTGRGNP